MRKPSSSVTLVQIAKITGLSARAVSSALNGNGRISNEKKREVQEVAAKLGYRPNIMARGLVQGKTFLLGVVFYSVCDSIVPEVLQGIEDQALLYGYRVIICSAGEHPLEIADLIRRGVDGIIINPTVGCPESYENLEKSGIPHVQIFHSNPLLSGPFLSVNDERGAFLATRHLIETTGTVPMYFGTPPGQREADTRSGGFRRAVEESGFQFSHEKHVYPGYTFNWLDGKTAVQDLIRHKRMPRGIFAVCDYVALGALRGAYEAGVKVPDELAVAGFDDLNLAHMQIGPALTTIRQPKQEIGAIAMRMLHDRIEGKPVADREMEPELIVRETTPSGEVLHAS